MTTFETVMLILLVVDALALGGLVLIQQGRGADVGAAFGSGSSNTMFGSAGSTSFLTKITTWLAIGFFVISFGLAYAAKERAASVSDLGIPSIAPVEQAADDAPDTAVPGSEAEQLTDPEEGVDSDIPDV
ncbi:MAG: preprotein translocase subunit SecG [Pseudomonadales bacterium]|jgi:preprotein translocase subunit SecG|nr:preprotein translocase subunit SecG [Pseudomonadales bacterium]MDP6469637.1 preprotein translocase subunit SecG [Pseudomonadales bacterium]MDP6827478.1 preprotein translocase subunit SecG [Pseudomonadales bacterium]MDP6973038.1 preprotein translocase subunit SecG [Pseudomonadales bacterium]|tara:strand:- start:60 stop:449 length:390 start_codon:yes stop_codon:yes gene_type:complete